MAYRKDLGDWGEAHAERLLAAAGFTDIQPLNVGRQHPGGDSLPIIGALLGHSNPRTTQRYAHVAKNPLRDAAERIAEAIAASFERKA